jgi:hypothetical protein
MVIVDWCVTCGVRAFLHLLVCGDVQLAGGGERLAVVRADAAGARSASVCGGAVPAVRV